MMLDSYALQKGIGIMGIDLPLSWELYFNSDRKLFYSIIDIKLNIFNVYSSARDLQMLWPRIDITSVFEFNRQWFNFVCSYRAFYDKYMNLIITSGCKEKIKEFEKAKSKNSMFKKILLENDTFFLADGVFLHIPKEFTNWSYEFIKYVNDQFRNPEIHSSGKARKWIFVNTSDEKEHREKFNSLLRNFHYFLNFMGVIAGGKKFCEKIDPKKQ